MSINIILEHIDKVKIKEAIAEIRYLLNGSKLNRNEAITLIDKEILQKRILENQGYYEEGILFTELFSNLCKELEINNLYLAAEVSKTYIYFHLGEIEKGFELVKELEKEFDHANLNNPIIKVWLSNLYNVKGNLYLEQGEFDESLKWQEKMLAMRKEIGDPDPIAAALNNIAVINIYKGDLQSALDIFFNCIEIWEKTGNQIYISMALNNIGDIFVRKGNLEKGLEFHRKSLELRLDIGNKQNIAYSLNNIANIHARIGNLDKALDYHQQSKELWEEIGNSQDIAASLNNIGIIYTRKGQMHKAISYFMEALKIWIKYHNDPDIAEVMLNLGIVYMMRKQYENAEYYLLESLAIRKQIKNKLKMAEIIIWLIRLYIYTEDQEKITKYIYQLEEMLEADNQVLQILYNYAMGLNLIHQERLREKVKSKQYFSKIIDHEIVDYVISIDSMLNLAKLLIDELSLFNNEEVLQEIMEILDEITRITRDISAYYLEVELLFIKSRLSSIMDDFEGSNMYLDHALDITGKYGLAKLHDQILQEKNKIKDTLQKYYKIYQNKTSIMEKVEQAQINEFINNFRRKISFTRQFE